MDIRASSDKWCVTGGYQSISGDTNITVNLRKTYANTSYNVLLTCCYTKNPTASAPCVDPTRAVNSFIIHPVTSSWSGCFWTTSGIVQ